MIQPLHAIELDLLIFLTKHVLEPAEAMVGESRIFVNSLFKSGAYSLQCLVFNEASTCMTGTNPYCDLSSTVLSKEYHHPVLHLEVPWEYERIM